MIGTRQMFYARLPAGEGHRRRGRLPARRGDAGEPGLSLDAQPHDAARRSARTVPDLHHRGRRYDGEPQIIRDRQNYPQQERRRRQDHLRRDLRRPRRPTTGCASSGVLSRAAVCRIFGIRRGADHRLRRSSTRHWRSSSRSTAGSPSGSPGDADIFGSQQYGPLLDIAVPTE